MKSSKKRIALSMLTAFIMVFTVIPYMGVNDAHAAASKSFVTTTHEITDANGTAAYVLPFEADESNSLDLKVSRKYFTGSESGGDFIVQIFDSSNGLIASETASGNIATFEGVNFPAADTYNMVLYSYQNKMGSTTYQIEFDLKAKSVYDYKFESLTAKVFDWHEGSQYEYADYYAVLYPGVYNGDDALDAIIYRENLATGKFAVPYLSDNYDESVVMGGQYKYYIVNRNHVQDYVTAELKAASNSAGSSKEIAISKNARTELTRMAATATVSIPGPKVQNVTSLKNKSKGVKSATLTWWYANGTPGYATGYEIKVYNSKGKVVKTAYATAGNIGTKVYIPYEGTSKVKVTAYYKYKGKTYYGKSQTIKVTSAKVKAPSVNVTKISGTKAKITVYKADGAAGMQVQQKKGGKWVNIATAATAKTYKKTWTKNKAGTSQYRVRSYVKDAGKTYYSPWKVVSPQKNQRTYTDLGLGYYRNCYKNSSSFFHPTKVVYSGSKIKVTGKFTNSWYIASTSCKMKITFKDNGKVVGTKTVSSGNLSAGSQKKVTFTLNNSKTGADLRTASYSVTYLKR